MATVQRIPKNPDRMYGDIWGKFDWKCTKCGTVYLQRWEAMQCCKTEAPQ